LSAFQLLSVPSLAEKLPGEAQGGVLRSPLEQGTC
jgi:hypothetical protein